MSYPEVSTVVLTSSGRSVFTRFREISIYKIFTSSGRSVLGYARSRKFCEILSKVEGRLTVYSYDPVYATARSAPESRHPDDATSPW